MHLPNFTYQASTEDFSMYKNYKRKEEEEKAILPYGACK